MKHPCPTCAIAAAGRLDAAEQTIAVQRIGLDHAAAKIRFLDKLAGESRSPGHTDPSSSDVPAKIDS